MKCYKRPQKNSNSNTKHKIFDKQQKEPKKSKGSILWTNFVVAAGERNQQDKYCVSFIHTNVLELASTKFSKRARRSADRS